ncbi:MAG: hypothetical protein ISS56_01975 [Anaerolineae bacterium]|nr:hypothetical protein [Anaerolineae bacterium]
MEKLAKEHYLDLENGMFAETTAADLDDLLAALSGHPDRDNLVIHFHGGLVSREAAHPIAERVFDTYRAGEAYPVFVIWNSGLLQTLRNNLSEIGKEEAFKRLVRRVAQFALGKLVETVGDRGQPLELTSMKNMPRNLDSLEAFLDERESTLAPAEDLALSKEQEDQIDNEFKKDLVLRREATLIANGLRKPDEVDEDLKTRGGSPVRGSTQTLMSASILKEIAEQTPDPSERSSQMVLALVTYGLKILKAVLQRYSTGRDHGLYTTIVEEVLRTLYLDNAGALVWKLIKNDTLHAFGGDLTKHGGTALAQGLAGSWHDGQRITLVGHSTGAIYIGEFLEEADKVLPAEARFDVVYLAAACSFKYLQERLELFERRVSNIRVFGLSDEIERSYWEVPVIYRGSLLYLVSGLFEEEEIDMPLVGMERYFGAEGPYDRPDIVDVLDYIKPEMRVWSGKAEGLGPGKRCTAATHGAFDDEDQPTRDSVAHLLREGF